MSAGGSLLTALIAASSLIAGVAITNWQQNKREQRSWNRQLQIYVQQWDDQRERDKLQREDQRERDREDAAREDRHRFTDFKRDLYGDVLSELTSMISHLGHCINAAKRESDRRGGESEGSGNGFRQFLYVQHREHYDGARSVSSSLSIERASLVSPDSLMVVVREIQHVTFLAIVKLCNEGRIGEVESGRDLARSKVEPLRQIMRDDLGGSPLL
ncbi:hypothetical protein ACGFKX_12370 [Pseudonocardia alni]|uniref:hypothetical protein n=1 Tax=Pseudonocardia alni TaxID=33907 RepID=UPI003710B1FD